jgi:hypothetical protein
MVFKPSPDSVRWEGVAVCTWLAVAQLLTLNWVATRPTDTLRFVLIALLLASVPLQLHLLYRTWIAFSLEYWLDRNALTVVWADVRQTIPLAGLQGMTAEGLPDLHPRRLWHWPAWYVRTTQSPGVGEVSALATAPLPTCVVLQTGAQFGGTVAVSPRSAPDFVSALHSHLRLGPVANVAPDRRRWLDWQKVVSADRLGLMLLAAGFAGCVLLFGALMVRYPSLPDVMAVRYGPGGIPEQAREKGVLFLLPVIGLLAWLVNGVWGLLMAAREQKTGAYLLWTGALIVQAVSFVALAALIL